MILGYLWLLLFFLSFKIRVNSKKWVCINSDEDGFKDPMMTGSNSSNGDVTTIKRINSHTQLFTRETGTEKKRK